MDYVQRTWPYFRRKKGSDHILVLTNDKGATFLRGTVSALRGMTLITQWGWKRPHIHLPEQDIVVPPMLRVDKLIGESPFISLKSSSATDTWLASHKRKYLLSFVGSVRFHTPGYSMGVRQAIFRRYNASEGFFLRDLRGDSYKGVHKKLEPKEYLAVLQDSKFCLAPSGMGFSTRSYESVAQGCVPLVIQDDPLSNTSVDQAFEELLPWSQFSLRLKQSDIPNLPELLDRFPLEQWQQLRRSLACVWPRVLWLQADNEAPGQQLDGEGKSSNATAALGDEAGLTQHDAWESIMHTLKRRLMRRRGVEPPPFEWRVQARSCQKVMGAAM